MIEFCNEYSGDDHKVGIFFLYAVSTHKPTNTSYSVEISINGSLCEMEVDSATDYMIIIYMTT